MLRYLRSIICIGVISIVIICSSIVTIEGSIKANKIKNIFDFDENIEIIINEVYYRKEKFPEIDKGQEIIISIDKLKEMFLNDAIVVSGEEINYMFEYETVVVFGYLKINEEKRYHFKYNLAGFGTIYVNDSEYVLYGDKTKLIFE